jgi:hypothetical protein
MLILPPPLAADPRGALLRLLSTAVGAGVSRETGWSHAYRVQAGSWSRWSTNAANGTSAPGVSSAKSETLAPRRPGLVGL